MHSYGDCGHIKARLDNHYCCLSSTSCSRFSTCYICSNWSDDIWILAEKTSRYKKISYDKYKKNKKKNRNVSDPSDTISLDGSTAPHGFTARGRTHLGGSQMQTNSIQAISLPVTGHPGTGQPVNGQPVTGQLITGYPGTGQPVTGQPVTGQPSTS